MVYYISYIYILCIILLCIILFFLLFGAVYRSRKKMVGRKSNRIIRFFSKLNLFGFSSFFRQFCLFFFVEINAIYS